MNGVLLKIRHLNTIAVLSNILHGQVQKSKQKHVTKESVRKHNQCTLLNMVGLFGFLAWCKDKNFHEIFPSYSKQISQVPFATWLELRHQQSSSWIWEGSPTTELHCTPFFPNGLGTSYHTRGTQRVSEGAYVFQGKQKRDPLFPGEHGGRTIENLLSMRGDHTTET